MLCHKDMVFLLYVFTVILNSFNIPAVPSEDFIIYSFLTERRDRFGHKYTNRIELYACSAFSSHEQNHLGAICSGKRGLAWHLK